MKTPKKEPIFVQLNLTPLIDLIMNLLIFFMLVSQMSVVERTPVDLPHVSQGRAAVIKPEDKVAITMKLAQPDDPQVPVYQVGSIKVAGLAEVSRRLEQVKAASPSVEMVLRADKNIPYKFVKEVMRTAGRQGIKVVEISVAMNGNSRP
jgi:biopolymer transport protein ExbD